MGQDKERLSSPVYHPRLVDAGKPASRDPNDQTNNAKLGLWPLVFLTFYGVSGGAFGIEQVSYT
jgi:hypothetical protein